MGMRRTQGKEERWSKNSRVFWWERLGDTKKWRKDGSLFLFIYHHSWYRYMFHCAVKPMLHPAIVQPCKLLDDDGFTKVIVLTRRPPIWSAWLSSISISDGTSSSMEPISELGWGRDNRSVPMFRSWFVVDEDVLVIGRIDVGRRLVRSAKLIFDYRVCATAKSTATGWPSNPWTKTSAGRKEDPERFYNNCLKEKKDFNTN